MDMDIHICGVLLKDKNIADVLMLKLDLKKAMD